MKPNVLSCIFYQMMADLILEAKTIFLEVVVLDNLQLLQLKIILHYKWKCNQKKVLLKHVVQKIKLHIS